MLLVASVFSVQVQAQLYSNTPIYVDDDAQIHVFKGGTSNGVVIDANGTFNNQGGIYLDGDWHNNNNNTELVLFTEEAGLVQLNGHTICFRSGD